MSDNNEDDFDLDNDQGFDEFEESSSTLGRVIQENPLAKVGIIFAVAALIFGLIILFGGSEERDPASYQGASSTVSGVPGTEDITQVMREAINEENDRRTEEAFQEGTSAIPIPIDPPVGVLQKAPSDDEKEDPLQRWRRLQQERLEKEMRQREVVQPATVPQDNQKQERINSLAELMQSQMQSILEQQGVYKWDYMNITDHDFLEQLADKDNGLESENVEGTASAETLEEIILPAGEIAFTQLLTEANSDVPGPALAQIVSGPLKGSRILGTFRVENDLIALEFNTIVMDGISYGISGIALDPENTLPAMATHVNHRYFQRVVLPMAAAFVKGAAEAVAESGRTNITIYGDTIVTEEEDVDTDEAVASGIEKAGSELREILDDIAGDIETLVVIAAGTPMGVLFLEPVTKPIEDDF